MVIDNRIHPPPPISTPKEAPWREVEAVADGLKVVVDRLDKLIALWAPPDGEPPVDVSVLLKDSIMTDMALDIRSFLIMLYRLGLAYEVRLFSYLEVDAAGTGAYTYTIPNNYVYIPHIEEVELGIQRVLTRYDYEDGNIAYTETYATDRTVDWTMTPLSRVVTGSFGVSISNIGTTDTWIKSRFLGTLMRESDYSTWKRIIRDVSAKYMGLSA